jgi:beta-lactamase regulating signal transducer with metallopeptidase domain
MDMFKGFTKEEIECVICHEVGHHVLKTANEKAADEFALRYVSKDVYLSTIAKTWMLLTEHRRQQGLPVKKYGEKYAHRNPLMWAYCAAHGINWNPGE